MDISESVRKQIVVVFYITCCLVFLPSIALLVGSGYYIHQDKSPNPPSVPPEITPLTLSPKSSKEIATLEADVYKKRLEYRLGLYEKQISLYKEQVAVWKQLDDKRPKMDLYSIYGLVVKDSIIQIIIAILTALITYAFVAKGAESFKSLMEDRKQERAARQSGSME